MGRRGQERRMIWFLKWQMAWYLERFQNAQIASEGTLSSIIKLGFTNAQDFKTMSSFAIVMLLSILTSLLERLGLNE